MIETSIFTGGRHCNGAIDSSGGSQKGCGFHHSILLLKLWLHNAHARSQNRQVADLLGHVFF